MTVRPTSAACGAIEVGGHHAVALPLAGVFAKHDGPRRHVLATPQHALLIRAGQPYRLSFPGCIGDRCLVLRLSDEDLEAALAEELDPRGFASAAYAPHLPLPPNLMLARAEYWRCLASGEADSLRAEELGIELVAQVLRAARRGGAARDAARFAGATAASSRRTHHGARRGAHNLPLASSRHNSRIKPVQRALEALAAGRPGERWSLAALAELASASPAHLARCFRAETGLTIHGYVMRSRLAAALDAVLDSDTALTEIALDAGFASHSHFTARFRALFGRTPLDLRRRLQPRQARELRRIVTAEDSAPA